MERTTTRRSSRKSEGESASRTPSAIQRCRSFQINASNYSAEYGRAAGGVVNTVTRSGGNALHGQVFYFYRSSNWAARNTSTMLTSKDALGIYQTAPYKPPHEIRCQGGIVRAAHQEGQGVLVLLLGRELSRFSGRGTGAASREIFRHAQHSGAANAGGAHSHQRTDQARANYSDTLDKLAAQLGEVDRTSNQSVFFPRSTGRSANATT